MKTTIFPYQKYDFSNQDLLKGLSKTICKIITQNQVTMSFNEGDLIFAENTIPKGIFLLKQGKIKKHTTTNFGKEHIFYICKENEYLGYHALLSEEFYPDSATAITNCDVVFFPKHDFLTALKKSYILSQRLLKNLSHEFSVFINATKILAKHTVRERTAINLLILNEKFKTELTATTSFSISRDDLASMVGTTKESVVRMLHHFEEEKLISKNRRIITIEDVTGLIKVTNYK